MEPIKHDELVLGQIVFREPDDLEDCESTAIDTAGVIHGDGGADHRLYWVYLTDDAEEATFKTEHHKYNHCTFRAWLIQPDEPLYRSQSDAIEAALQVSEHYYRKRLEDVARARERFGNVQP